MIISDNKVPQISYIHRHIGTDTHKRMYIALIFSFYPRNFSPPPPIGFGALGFRAAGRGGASPQNPENPIMKQEHSLKN